MNPTDTKKTLNMKKSINRYALLSQAPNLMTKGIPNSFSGSKFEFTLFSFRRVSIFSTQNSHNNHKDELRANGIHDGRLTGFSPML